MNASSYAHSSIYFKGFLYVIGGSQGSGGISKCERYSSGGSQWEDLPPMPERVYLPSLLMQDSSQMLYVLGGSRFNGAGSDFIQELDIPKLTWRLLELKLPLCTDSIACFKSDNEVYFVQQSTLYHLDLSAFQIKLRKLLSGTIKSCGPSYYSRGTLYATNTGGEAFKLSIGSLRE
eukprot:CAMPEP_0204905176 /NCGR_PEP_ID=MMETSP1397-20131031/5285_1 /ASSEMBLY_ACC=CAM_ASM_000891 /TAXON_ID=49980 /ORGANISM="Climacostomum Climacostomum virens, Strain Stock W-24" /LENGTH=175 /DNA_ID=CAMNT_0052074045 /DNA_START=271 /DNA_END=798 /DNA_ORIENTATION=-